MASRGCLSSKKSPVPFFTDNDVDDKVGDLLRESGHQVVRLREVMLDNSPDPVVAAACREHGLVLVTHNIKHFRAIVKDYEVTRAETDRLCRIELGCEQFRAVDRVRAALEIIEYEWSRRDSSVPIRIHIGDGIIRIHR
ncbi:DUF5615 family PIN-like protein [Novosphingobium lentum]|uniref:DUF5615 family PIN-like protein n=1 Tax=Novosphingobium lentum TaxID=145287 RepID=UPI0034E1FCCD